MPVHQRMSQVIRKAIAAAAATSMAFAMLAGGAVAAPPIARDHIASAGAAATNQVCVGTLCTATSVFAMANEPGGPTQACLDITRYEQVGTSFVQLGYETGCGPLAEGSLSIDARDLSAATLSPVEISVQAFTCDPVGCTPTGTRTAIVSAAFTGVGEIATFRSNSKSTFGGCTMYFVGKGSSREAVATLTIDGRSLDGTGSLFASTQKIKAICH